MAHVDEDNVLFSPPELHKAINAILGRPQVTGAGQTSKGNRQARRHVVGLVVLHDEPDAACLGDPRHLDGRSFIRGLVAPADGQTQNRPEDHAPPFHTSFNPLHPNSVVHRSPPDIKVFSHYDRTGKRLPVPS